MTLFNHAATLAPVRAVPLPGTVPPAAPPCPGLYQRAGTFDPDFLLDPDLTAPLDTHIARHVVPGLDMENQRGLLIVGEPGDGKTTAVRVHTSRRGLDLLQMPAADLCGATEGLAVQRLNEAHAFIRAKSAETGRHFVLLLDDVDASILDERKDQERTINTDLLIGKLQSILESPNAFCDARGVPVAFVLTANSTASLRPALVRAGRCELLSYHPTWQRKADILIHHLKPDSETDQRRLRWLVYLYRAYSLSWFSTLTADLRRAAIAAAVAEHGLDDHDAIVHAANAVKLDTLGLFRLAKARHWSTNPTTETPT